MMVVYLLHFARPLHHAQHYLGCSANLPRRLAEHRKGVGARLPAVMRGLGIGFTLARIWEDQGRSFERRLKRRKEGRRLCPICSPPALRDEWPF